MREYHGQQHIKVACTAVVFGRLHSQLSTERGLCLLLNSGCLFIRHTACLLSMYAGGWLLEVQQWSCSCIKESYC